LPRAAKAADAIKPDDIGAETHSQLARSLAEIIGQGGLVKRLTGLVELARHRGETLGHILLLGPDGCGKSTAAHTIARELGVNLRATEASQIERVSDLAAIINDLDEGEVLLVENVNRLQKDFVSVMLPALKDFELIIVVGKGPGARI
jgi:holliday junction DNA helicase RuvB